jgi:hypothetical protein
VNQPTTPRDEIRAALQTAVAGYRRHTTFVKRLSIGICTLFLLTMLGLLVGLAFGKVPPLVVTGEFPLAAVVTLFYSRFEKMTACEFDCDFFEVQFLNKGSAGLDEALSNTRCREVLQLAHRFKDSENGD